MSTSKTYTLFLELAAALPEGKLSQMFGCPCVKVPSGKAAFCIYKEDLVIKLDNDTQKDMLAFDGIQVFSPMGDRPMNGWLQIPYSYQDQWLELAKKSFDFVNNIEVKEKPKKSKKA